MEMKKTFKLSLIAAACYAAISPVQAGQITGVATGSAYDSQGGPVAFGIGGLNQDNVTPLIINVETGEVVADKVFDQETGAYTQMEVGDTFKTIIYTDNTKLVESASLHGKDWPVGEPHGIKVANSEGPTDVMSNEKPASCILSTSFFTNGDDPKNYDEEGNYTGTEPADEGWLNTADESTVNPTYCNSPFQTHKRFKVDALTPKADDIDKTVAKPIDLVFNVEAGEADVRQYMVLQKLNNYSDVRYQGLTIEVGFGTGDSFQNAFNVEGVGGNLQLTYATINETPYVFAEDDRATFSAGLFGTADEKHPNDGFFDTNKAGFDIDVDGNGTSAATTGTMASNYDTIFGNWLPSKWEPTGVFYDDDNNPLTDAALVAYWGPSPTDETVAWRKGQADSFAIITDSEIQEVANEVAKDASLYSVGGIEDLLNLGLTYVVNVGDPSSFPVEANSTFTIRMTPTVAVGDTEEPSWISTPASLPDAIVDSGTTTTSSSGGGSASEFSITSLILALLAIAGLGGWLASRKKA